MSERAYDVAVGVFFGLWLFAVSVAAIGGLFLLALWYRTH